VVKNTLNKFRPKNQSRQSVVLKTFKWDLFLALVTEGLIEILTNTADQVLILATLAQLEPYQIYLLISRILMVISTIYLSTKFLWNKQLYDKDLKLV